MDRLGVMEVFVLAVETGSFSAVGRRLGLGQPTVSKLIAQLAMHGQTSVNKIYDPAAGSGSCPISSAANPEQSMKKSASIRRPCKW